ncbi:structural maintenance of chromosomes protein 5-like [Oscarella lobularis]|uniref:structural maintenance of chromosomes protein 5-like n=1 Tax=Oscarella lobularis TaxID=121494 RepID=UPI003313D549
MNIQLSNLCQFLPQDKVVDFAKMNPLVDLFRATVKAEELHNMEEGGKEMKARQEQLTQQQELHRGDYYYSLRDVHTAAKERLSVATRQLKQAKDGFRPIQRKITEATDNVDAHKISTRDLSHKVTKGRQDVSGKLSTLQSLEHDLEEPKQTYEDARIKEKKRMEEEIRALKDKQEALPPSEDVSAQANELAHKISKCSRDINRVSTDRTRIRQESDEKLDQEIDKRRKRRCSWKKTFFFHFLGLRHFAGGAVQRELIRLGYEGGSTLFLHYGLTVDLLQR